MFEGLVPFLEIIGVRPEYPSPGPIAEIAREIYFVGCRGLNNLLVLGHRFLMKCLFGSLNEIDCIKSRLWRFSLCDAIKQIRSWKWLAPWKSVSVSGWSLEKVDRLSNLQKGIFMRSRIVPIQI